MTDITQLRTSLADRYEIDREIGRGGMATVYLARDVRHDRKVALKVLNPELGAVLGVERFLAEIKVTANLQHPNLLPLFDSGEAGGLLFYVMPFVEGESLRARLDREKQLPIDDAIRMSVAIAGALDYAHGNGVIHRDLKPENILLQHGQAVVADFGIALAVSKAGGSRITQTGLSLGTPQYMSPEQATGDRVIDGRSDIYSLAAMTYEMLTGEPPHTGNTAQAIIARVLTDNPRPIRTTRSAVPEHVELAVERALEKLAADRFATAREYSDALSGKATHAAQRTKAARGGSAPSRMRDPVVLGLAVVAVVSIVALGARELSRGRADSGAGTSRFFLTLPANLQVLEAGGGGTLAISPDGRTLAFVSNTPSGSQLFIRPIDQLAAIPVPETRQARNPAFSPDGRSIAFTAGNDIKKVSVDGGPVSTLGTLGAARGVGLMFGLSWAGPSRIIVGTVSGLHEIPAAGGAPQLVTNLLKEQNESGQRWPLVLPGAKSVIYMSSGPTGGSAGAVIAVASLETGKAKRLGMPGTSAVGLFDGLLVYASAEGRLMAIPYDAGRDTVTGNAFPVVEEVLSDNLGVARAALSQSGTLVYLSGTTFSQPVIVDSRGATVPILQERRSYANPRFSRDGLRVAYGVTLGQVSDIWVQDRAKGTVTRLTSDGTSARPEWSPDGKRVLFSSLRGDGLPEVWWAPADGRAAAELLYKPTHHFNEAFLSPDEAWLVYRTTPGAERPFSIYAVPLKGDRKEIPILTGAARYRTPSLSPDGRWLAYDSDESGPFDIYVRPFPGPGARVQVSTDGGTAPMWGPDGRTLYYLNDADVMQVSVTTGASFSIGARRKRFTGEYIGDPTHQNYDISRDGEHLLLLRRGGEGARVVIVLNWPRDLAAKRAAQVTR